MACDQDALLGVRVVQHLLRVVQVNDDEYSELAGKAQQLKDLQKHPGWAVWDTVVRRRIEAKQREMLAGKDSLQEYRYTAGWIEGAQATLDALGLLERQTERERARRKEAKAA